MQYRYSKGFYIFNTFSVQPNSEDTLTWLKPLRDFAPSLHRAVLLNPAIKKSVRRITWKPDEQAKVVGRATELLAATPRMPMHVAARRAQEQVLAPERWKQIRQHKDVERWLPFRPDAPPPLRPYPRAIKPALVFRSVVN
jgi:hypothetical protein